MSFNTALSGLKGASSDLEITGNNIANASTSGFKKSRAEFADVYAASAMGASSNSIGTGVILRSVTQQFSQGNINFTENNLDMAVNGQGFFILEDAGSIVYSRAGSFGVDREGYISNASGQRLRGFLADNDGNVTGAQGSMQISTANLAPRKTDQVTMAMNLNADAAPPTKDFSIGFTAANPPDPNSYTATTSTNIYDSLGNDHILTTYLVKAPQVNQWRAYFAIDGNDVTPSASSAPSGIPPQNYNASDIAAPFTMIFSESGAYVSNNASATPQYYGATPVSNGATVLSNQGTLAAISSGDLIINGIDIPLTKDSFDAYSSTDKSASSVALANSINQKTDLHGVTATPKMNTFDLGDITLGDLAAGDLTINGRQIIGTIGSVADALTLINSETSYTGIRATNPAGSQIILEVDDGRNIQLETAGSVASGASFTNYSLQGGALNQVKRGQIDLVIDNNQSIVIGGANPSKAGFGIGPIAGILYSNSDTLRIPNWNPGTGAESPQNIDIDFSKSTQFGAAFSVQEIEQDGYSTGRLSNIEIDTSGTILARYTNGQSISRGRVTLANFGNVQGLQAVGDSAWIETFTSGPALIGSPGTSSLGVIQSGALENSNVDITDELVALIEAQRNFQANAQTIKTADAVTQSIINIR